MKPDREQIVVYATAWCPDCMRARRVLDRRHADYRWVDIDQDAQARDYVEELNRGFRSVPTIVFPDGSVLVEPSDWELSDRLAAMSRPT